MKFKTGSSLLCSFLTLCVTALAGVAPTKAVVEPAEEVTVDFFDLRASHVFESDIKSGDDLGSQSATQSALSYSHRFPISGNWYFRAGAEYERFDFSSTRADLPVTLQSASALLALEYVVSNRIGAYLGVTPGFRFEHEISSGSFDAPVLLYAAYRANDNLYLVGGATAGILRKYAVLPIVGAIWEINDDWQLNLYFPRPALIYSPSENWSLQFAGEYVGGSFKRDDEKETEFGGAVVSYREYRAGVFFEYETGPFTVEAGAGYTFQRRFDYFRIGEEFRTEGAPFVSLGISAQF